MKDKGLLARLLTLAIGMMLLLGLAISPVAIGQDGFPLVPFFVCENSNASFGICFFPGSLVLSDGTLGIGTNAPKSPLHVSATPESTTNMLILADNKVSSGDTEGIVAVVNSLNGEAIEAINTHPDSRANTLIACSAQSANGDCAQGSVVFRVRRNGNVTADGTFTGGGADYADMMRIAGNSEDFSPGDVLAIDPAGGGLIKAVQPYSQAVAGVYSTQPAFVGDARGLLEEEQEQSTFIPVALLGIVPVKVTAENGAIHPGDLLTTSSIPGYAMKAQPVLVGGVEVYPAGSILGKAMGSLEEGEGIVQVLITLK